jgi:hypothetical protein
MEENPMESGSISKLMAAALLFAGTGARAEDWVSVWTPPKPATGGMESFVDRTSIEVMADYRRAKWRMTRWISESYATEHLSIINPVGNFVIYVIVITTFDCAGERVRDEQTTMYMSDGTNNAGAIKAGKWSPVGQLGPPGAPGRAVFDFV